MAPCWWRTIRPTGSGECPTAAPESRSRWAKLREGLARPESARWDADQRVWFISNINGAQEKDNNGYISRVSAEGRMQRQRFIAGGTGGVVLHAPKGMAITGDTLWVTDLDVVRGFHRRTGAPVATVDLAPLGALFLNDITAGPDGSLYVTDTGVRFDSAGTRQHTGPDRVYRIRGRTPTVALEGDVLGEPNGIAWDSEAPPVSAGTDRRRQRGAGLGRPGHRACGDREGAGALRWHRGAAGGTDPGVGLERFDGERDRGRPAAAADPRGERRRRTSAWTRRRASWRSRCCGRIGWSSGGSGNNLGGRLMLRVPRPIVSPAVVAAKEGARTAAQASRSTR